MVKGQCDTKCKNNEIPLGPLRQKVLLKNAKMRKQEVTMSKTRRYETKTRRFYDANPKVRRRRPGGTTTKTRRYDDEDPKVRRR